MHELLFLCHRIPYPPDKGDKIRAFHILEHLARSFRVHLGCLADNRADLAFVPALRERTASLACFPLDRGAARLRSAAALRPNRPLSLGYFHDARLASWVAETLARRPIRQIFVFSSAMAPYVMGARPLPRILDMVDVDSEKFAAYAAAARLPMRLLWSREAQTLLAFERRAALHFDRTLFVSPAEEARFLALAPDCAGRTGWVENGVDLDYFSPRHRFAAPTDPAPGPRPSPSPSPSIVFTGAMDYRPNIDAAVWFADTVLPLLAGRRPAPVFTIVGSDPAQAVRALGRRPGIRVTGRVADTRPYLAEAAVVVAPLRIGRGIQNKVLEAMAMGRPVVASPAASEGIRGQPGRDLLVAGDAGNAARLVGEVLDGGHRGLGAAGREAVLRHHDWSATLARLDTMIERERPALPTLVGVGG